MSEAGLASPYLGRPIHSPPVKCHQLIRPLSLPNMRLLWVKQGALVLFYYDC